jgi:hypothetical protein
MPKFLKLVLLFVLFAIQTHASSETGFAVYVIEKTNLRAGSNIKLTDGELLFDEKDVDSLNWQNQTFQMTLPATKELIRNSAELEDESNESFTPQGEFADAEGKAFIIIFDGKPILTGVVAGMKTLEHPPDASLLYPYVPMIENGKLIIGVGHPIGDEELRESFFKVLIEEGPANCFKPVLDEKIRKYFSKLNKMKQR